MLFSTKRNQESLGRWLILRLESEGKETLQKQKDGARHRGIGANLQELAMVKAGTI